MRFDTRARAFIGDVERQLALARWVLPLFLFVMVFFYEAREHLVNNRETPPSPNFFGEVFIIGMIGPTAMFFVMLWIGRSLKARAQAQQELQRMYDDMARTQIELAALHQQRGELVQKLISAQEEERQRLARDIHDELGQVLTRLSISLKLCESSVAPSTTVGQQLQSMQTLVWQTIDQAHRLIADLRPLVLDELGLEAALREELRQRFIPLDITAGLTSDGAAQRLLPAVEIAVFRITQEALTNVVRHAHAQQVTVSLHHGAEMLTLIIEDDGIGIPAAMLAPRDEHRPLGLLGMRERAALLGGALSIEPHLLHGTRVTLRVPLATRAGNVAARFIPAPNPIDAVSAHHVPN